MLKVLIVEDNLMIADMTEEVLIGHGYEVCGIASTVEEAVGLCLLHDPDLAVVDVRLGHGELGTEIPNRLGGLGRLGVLYATGNIGHVTLTTENGHACLAKPYSAHDLCRGLELVAEIVATGRATAPFPRGFKVLHPVAASKPIVPNG